MRRRVLLDIATTGAGETVKRAATATKRAARQTRKVPGVAQVEGQVKGAVASESDLAIARYDALTADEILGRLPQLSQVDLAKVDSYERRHENRTHGAGARLHPARQRAVAGLRRAQRLRGPRRARRGRRRPRLKAVRTYERAHKARTSVLDAAERELATA